MTLSFCAFPVAYFFSNRACLWSGGRGGGLHAPLIFWRLAAEPFSLLKKAAPKLSLLLKSHCRRARGGKVHPPPGHHIHIVLGGAPRTWPRWWGPSVPFGWIFGASPSECGSFAHAAAAMPRWLRPPLKPMRRHSACKRLFDPVKKNWFRTWTHHVAFISIISIISLSMFVGITRSLRNECLRKIEKKVEQTRNLSFVIRLTRLVTENIQLKTSKELRSPTLW